LYRILANLAHLSWRTQQVRQTCRELLSCAIVTDGNDFLRTSEFKEMNMFKRRPDNNFWPADAHLRLGDSGFHDVNRGQQRVKYVGYGLLGRVPAGKLGGGWRTALKQALLDVFHRQSIVADPARKHARQLVGPACCPVFGPQWDQLLAGHDMMVHIDRDDNVRTHSAYGTYRNWIHQSTIHQQ